MSLETAIETLTAAVLANTAAQTGEKTKKAAKTAAEPKTTETPATAPTEPTAPTVSAKEVADAILKLATDKGRDAAVAVLTEFKAGKVSELKPADFAGALAAAKAALVKPDNSSLV